MVHIVHHSSLTLPALQHQADKVLNVTTMVDIKNNIQAHYFLLLA